jgi:hypothetical protein
LLPGGKLISTVMADTTGKLVVAGPDVLEGEVPHEPYSWRES